MEILSFILGAVATVLSAFVILYGKEWMDKKRLLKSLYGEVEDNLALAKNVLPKVKSFSSRFGSASVFDLQRLHTYSYQDVRRSGYLLSLPKDVRLLLNETYELIFAFNRQTEANIYSTPFVPGTLSPMPPRTAGYLEKLEKIIQNLKVLTKVMRKS